MSFRLPSRYAFLAALLLALPAVARTPGFLGRADTQIVGDSGPVLLRGVNLGNWLFNESYFTGAPFDNYAWPAGLKDVLGTDANVAAFYSAYRANYTTQPDIQRIKALGFNSVRVPLDYALFYDTATGQIRNDNWVWLDNLLGWCAGAGVYAVFDMHGSPAQVTGHLPLFFDSNEQGQLALVWWAIANRYKDNVWLAGYDLLNEPVIDNQADKWRLRDLYVNLTNSIRSADTNHLIFAEGNYYGSDLYDLDPRWDENMAFSIHNYWTPVPNPQLATQVQLANASDVPLWLGETGENSNTWMNAEVRSVESYGIGWAMWPYKFPSERLNSITWVATTAGYQAVLDYWNGTGAKPSPSAAYAALLDMAQRTARANCTDNLDVVDALLRVDFHTTAVPFSQNIAPGRIYASEYDMGAQGIASNDSVYQTTAQGSSYTNWNNGFLYRNDGVDLGFLYDNGNHYYIGWTDAGEWVRYTFASGAGQPTLSLSYASVANQQLHIEIDGANATGTVSLPATGDWGIFTTVPVPNTATLAAGLHTMRVVFDTGGVNLYWVAFAGLAPPLPAPWSDADIGGPPRVGDAFAAGGNWTVAGGGADIFGTSDQQHFASQSLTGDGVIVARVTGLANTDPWAKAGVMIRDGTGATARNALLAITPGNGVAMQWRDTDGGASTPWGTSTDTAPYWLRLARSGSLFTAWKSSDGVTWTTIHSVTLALPAALRFGLAVTSHNSAALNPATFDNVSVNPLPAGFSSWSAFQNANFTAAQLANAGVSGPLADANGDGLENLPAYAFGLSPWMTATAANGGFPTAQIQSGHLTLTYTRLRLPMDVACAVEVTGDLATWNSGPAFTTELSATPLDAVRAQVVVRDNTPVSGTARRSMRVRTTLTAP